MSMEMDRSILRQFQRGPGLVSSFAGLDTLLGRDETIGFEDYLGGACAHPESSVGVVRHAGSVGVWSAAGRGLALHRMPAWLIVSLLACLARRAACVIYFSILVSFSLCGMPCGPWRARLHTCPPHLESPTLCMLAALLPVTCCRFDIFVCHLLFCACSAGAVPRAACVLRPRTVPTEAAPVRRHVFAPSRV